MVRGLDGEKLDEWLTEADASEAEVMRKFANGLRKDLSAVRAGLTETWSNGPVEGFVHKLKLVKRQGYGRAGFDLLRRGSWPHKRGCKQRRARNIAFTKNAGEPLLALPRSW